MTRLALALVILCATALPAWGQQECYEYQTVVKNLAKLHGEYLIGAGLGNDDKTTLRIFANPHGETWTAIEVTRFTDGKRWACLVKAGKFWRRMPLPLGPVS